ncbi:MAG: transporter substrate-binding domain-containing protein [Rhodospirillales bacterium]|nr:transporter substrate-binding domain-containing protein [Rhodospirillales bacterium]
MTEDLLGRLSRRGLAGAAVLLPAAAIAAPAAAATAAGGESTFARVMRTKKLRISALSGEPPYFDKNLATGKWGGFCVPMAEDIAKVFRAEVVYVDSTWGTSVLNLQSGKVDLSFSLNPTPQRALAIGFTEPLLIHPFGCIAKPGFTPSTWADLDKPGLRLAISVGSLYQVLAKRYAPKATAVGLPSTDQCVLALQSGRADAIPLAAIPGLGVIGKNPSLGTYRLIGDPTIALPSNLGIPRQTDTRFRDVLNAWIEYHGGVGDIRQWIVEALAAEGVKASQLPAGLTF